MDQDGRRVVKKVREAWNAAVYSMGRMYTGINIRPDVPDAVFTPVQDIPKGCVKIEVAPIVFNVPERADAGKANLYIVVAGWLSFDTKNDESKIIKTNNFGTQVAYFRSKCNSLEHIYGAHYDMDERGKGHPVFHSQLRSQMEFGGSIEQQYRINSERVDCIKKLCRGIRIPTAQMDLFSVIIQICADHLMWENSPKEVELEFEKTRKICSFFSGAAHKLAFLQEQCVVECFRSTHWYGQ